MPEVFNALPEGDRTIAPAIDANSTERYGRPSMGAARMPTEVERRGRATLAEIAAVDATAAECVAIHCGRASRLGHTPIAVLRAIGQAILANRTGTCAFDAQGLNAAVSKSLAINVIHRAIITLADAGLVAWGRGQRGYVFALTLPPGETWPDLITGYAKRHPLWALARSGAVPVHRVELERTRFTKAGIIYRVWHDGKVLIEKCRDPEYAACRSLAELGLTGVLRTFTHPGGATCRMLLDIEQAAKSMVIEGAKTPLQTVKYHEHPGSDAWSQEE